MLPSSVIQKRRRDRNQLESDPASVGTIREVVKPHQAKMGDPVISGHNRTPATIFKQVTRSCHPQLSPKDTLI